MLTQSQVQDSRTEQVVKYQIQTKRQTSHTRHTIKKRDECHTKKERQTKPVYHHEHANTNHTPERRITPQRDKNKKEKPHDTFPPHQPQHPATPADTDPHPIILFFTHLRAPVLIISATAHTLNYTLLTTPCPHTACRHCTHHLFYHPSPLYHHPCLHPCPQLHLCLSRSRYRSPSTCVPLPDGRYGPPPPGYHCLPVPLPARLLSTYCSHVCLHYCAHPSRHYA